MVIWQQHLCISIFFEQIKSAEHLLSNISLSSKSMETEINSFFDKNFVPLVHNMSLKKETTSFPTLKLQKSDTPDTDKWKLNGFDEKYYEALYKTSIGGDYYTIVSFLDININLFEWQYTKYSNKNVVNYPFFVADKPDVILIKSLFYFYLDVLPIKNVLYVLHTSEKPVTTYLSNLIIDNTNELDPFNIPFRKYEMISISLNMFINNRWGLEEYVKHQRIFRYLLASIQMLQNNGLIVIIIPACLSNLTMEIITLFSRYFKKITVSKPSYHQISVDRYISFKGFKSNLKKQHLESMLEIAKKWESLEPSLGEKLNLHSNKRTNTPYIYSNLKPYEKNDASVFVSSLGVPVNKKIRTHLVKVTEVIQKKSIDIINFGFKVFNYYSLHKDILQKLIKINISHTIKYCKSLSIAITPSKEIMQYNTLEPLYLPLYNISKKFTNIQTVLIDPKNVRITDEGKYSVTFPTDANIMSNLISTIFSDNNIILDGTANMGGNTLSFAKFFQSVISVELDKKNFDALKHNVGLYGFKNIELIHGDTLDVIRNDKIEYDILFLDPPWGGKDYKKHSLLDLKLGNTYVRDLIGVLRNDNKKGIVFKLPKNFKLTDQFLKGNALSIYKISNYYFAVIRFA